VPRVRRAAGWIAMGVGALLWAVAPAAPVAAHKLAPSLLQLEERADGGFDASFKTPRQRPAGVEIAPVLPATCRETAAPRVEADAASVTLRWQLDCGAEGLVGQSLGVSGLAESSTNALVRVALRDGRRMQAVLHGGEPTFEVPERATASSVLRDYTRLGFEHIATGFDHLLFVFGLLLLARGARQLVATVTAFTLGHSVTLSLAALGFVDFPSGLIELVIAATLLALALELARRPPRPGSLLRRRPWAVAAGFGLLHGLGFAGALSEVGLPQEEIPLALLAFNVGIELGQLAFVVAVLIVRAWAAPLFGALPEGLRAAPVTAMGALAVYWCLDRGAALF